jgi:predicted Fe-Mo cluster-binding NifX family protein
VTSKDLKNPSWYINEEEDPLLEMLKVYDEMILDLLGIKNAELIIATGLSQNPYEKLKFYYRLKDHKSFLEKAGIKFKNVVPRMTRDFLVSFDSIEDAKVAQDKLSKILVDNKIKLFEEIDNRGKDIFVVLTYPFEITKSTVMSFLDKEYILDELVTFVAIKNGEHQQKGYAYFSKGLSEFTPSEYNHVSKIHNTVLQFFGIIN